MNFLYFSYEFPIGSNFLDPKQDKLQDSQQECDSLNVDMAALRESLAAVTADLPDLVKYILDFSCIFNSMLWYFGGFNYS